jgi:hypothetical protein
MLISGVTTAHPRTLHAITKYGSLTLCEMLNTQRAFECMTLPLCEIKLLFKDLLTDQQFLCMP